MKYSTKKSSILAVIGGVGYNKLEKANPLCIITDYGKVNGFILDLNHKQILFIPRHAGNRKHIPPHKINYPANIMAIKQLGIKKIISINSVGSLHSNYTTGNFVLPVDFIDFTYNRINTFFEHKTVHADMSDPYCLNLRNIIKSVLNNKKINIDEVIYACTQGPRFETKAEIRMLSKFADVVGMTGLPEVVLAREMDLCYASICLITNMACGIINTSENDDILKIIASKQNELFNIISDITEQISSSEQTCNCRENQNLTL